MANPVSVDFPSRELEYILRFSASKAFVGCQSFRDFDHQAMIEKLRPKLPGLRLVALVRGGGSGGTVSLDQAIHGPAIHGPAIHGDGPAPEFTPYVLDANAIFRIAFTSGTTGDPEGVIHSQNTTVDTAMIQHRAMGVRGEEGFMH